VRVKLPLVAVVVVACTAGCGGSRVRSEAQHPKPVTQRERMAIFNDWYADGRIDGVYSCAVVRDALSRLPTDAVYSRAVQDFTEYEKRAC
jgi:hypothetical protein